MSRGSRGSGGAYRPPVTVRQARPAAMRRAARRPRPMAGRRVISPSAARSIRPAVRRGYPPRRRRFRGVRPRWRRGFWSRRWWDWGGPWPLYPYPDDFPFGDVGSPAIDSLSEPARRSLSRLGLLSGVWRRRLAAAGPELTRFINRFHRVAGVGRVIEDCFAGRYRRAVALMAIRLSHQLAGSHPARARNLYFDRQITFAPDNSPTLTVVVDYKGFQHRLFPWRRLHGQALRRQMRRDKLMAGAPREVRWVFSRRAMPSGNRLRDQLYRVLSDGGGQDDRRWAEALGRTALIV